MTNQKPFCPVCGSRRFLGHLDGCTAWQIPIVWPAPDPSDDGAVNSNQESSPSPPAAAHVMPIPDDRRT